MVKTYDFVGVGRGMDSDHKMIESTTNGVPDDMGDWVRKDDYDALAADKADDVRRMADDANKLHAAYSRIRELEAELEHYRVEGAYQRGYKDAIQNDGRTNPYPVGTESSRLWSAGFSTVDRGGEP